MNGRIPPNALDAEAMVLSTILLDPEAFDEVEQVLRAEHFYSDANRLVYQAAQELRASGQPVDLVQVGGYLRSTGRIDQIGGMSYLAQLTDNTPATVTLLAHAKTIADKWRLRRLIAVGSEIAARGYGDPLDVPGFVQECEAAVYAVSQDMSRAVDTTAGIRDVIDECLTTLRAKRSRTEPTGLRTGFRGLDKRLGGLRAGRVYVAAGRPGMGKTSWLTQVSAAAAARDPGPVGVSLFSIEMPRKDIGDRLLAQDSAIDTRLIDTGIMKHDQFAQLVDSAARLAHWPIVVDDKAAITVSEMRSALRRHVRMLHPVKLGLIGVDYLQLVGTKDLPRGLSTNDQLERVMAGLVSIAKEFDAPLIVLSQLNRECEKRPDKRPIMADLRSSGSIEQDAYAVIFLYREDQYRAPGEEKDNTGEFIVAKARNGRTGTVKATFIASCTRYEDTGETDGAYDEFDEMFDSFEKGGSEYEVAYP